MLENRQPHEDGVLGPDINLVIYSKVVEHIKLDILSQKKVCRGSIGGHFGGKFKFPDNPKWKESHILPFWGQISILSYIFKW